MPLRELAHPEDKKKPCLRSQKLCLNLVNYYSRYGFKRKVTLKTTTLVVDYNIIR